MTTEQKCVSLETAKKLRDAGFPQKNIERYWMNDIAQNPGKYKDEWYIRYADDWPLTTEPDYIKFDDTLLYSIAAPDAQELGDMLPYTVTSYDLSLFKEKDEWVIAYTYYGNFRIGPFKNKYLSESLASCWLYLKEQKLI